MFKFIKAVSDTGVDMINVIYHDKPLIFIGATFQEKIVYHHQAVNEALEVTMLDVNQYNI